LILPEWGNEGKTNTATTKQPVMLLQNKFRRDKNKYKEEKTPQLKTTTTNTLTIRHKQDKQSPTSQPKLIAITNLINTEFKNNEPILQLPSKITWEAKLTQELGAGTWCQPQRPIFKLQPKKRKQIKTGMLLQKKIRKHKSKHKEERQPLPKIKKRGTAMEKAGVRQKHVKRNNAAIKQTEIDIKFSLPLHDCQANHSHNWSACFESMLKASLISESYTDKKHKKHTTNKRQSKQDTS